MKRVTASLAAALLIVTAVRIPSARAASGLSPVETEELTMSYSLLTSEYYKKTDAQTLLDGARGGIVTYLKKNGVASPNLPIVHAALGGDDPAANAHQLEREVTLAVSEYGGKVGSRELTYQAISGLLASVHDKYTVFLSPKEYAALNEGLDGGGFSGVGIVIGLDDKSKQLKVQEVIDNGPADKAGVKSDDTIVSIDGKPTAGITTQNASKELRGKEGSQVKLQISRGGANVDPITVTRAVIHEPSVYSKLLDNGIGYTRLTVFGQSTATELTSALTKLEAQGAKAYVLDLRDNGGGYLNAAIDVSSKFIPTGPIVSVENRGGQNTSYDANNTSIVPRPLAVLVNKYTASASEITSGAIQDEGVGKLIGERTYGKGVVQTIHPLEDGSAVKITTARYLTPNGRDINLVGIQPDISTPEPKTSRFGDLAKDPQLQAAVQYLQGRIAAIGT